MFRGSYINCVFSGFSSFLVHILVHELELSLLDNRKMTYFDFFELYLFPELDLLCLEIVWCLSLHLLRVISVISVICH